MDNKWSGQTNRDFTNTQFTITSSLRKWGWTAIISGGIMLLLLFYLYFLAPDNISVDTEIRLALIVAVFCLIFMISIALFIYKITVEQWNAKVNRRINRINM